MCNNLKVFFLVFLFIFSSSLTVNFVRSEDAPKKKITRINGEWSGDAKDKNVNYTLKVFFSQDDKGNLAGYFIWKDEFGGSAKEFIQGNINIKGQIKLIGTLIKNAVNKFPNGAKYITGAYTAKLSRDENSIDGRWISSDPGTFRLTKKIK